jgi:hypothetical protein
VLAVLSVIDVSRGKPQTTTLQRQSLSIDKAENKLSTGGLSNHFTYSHFWC